MSYGHYFNEVKNDTDLKIGERAYRKIESDFVDYIKQNHKQNPTGFKNEELGKEFIEDVKIILKSSLLLNQKNLSLPKLDWDTSKWLISIVSEYDRGLGELFEKLLKI